MKMKKLKINQKTEAVGISLLLLSSFYFYEFTYLSLPSFKTIIIDLIKILLLLIFLNLIFLNFYRLKFSNFFLFIYLVYISIFTLKLFFNASDVITLHLFIEKTFYHFIQWDIYNKPISIKIISYSTPFILIILFLKFFLKKLENIKKFLSILGILVSIVIITDLIDIYKKQTNIDDQIIVKDNFKNEKRKVIWILYDALDPEYLNKEVKDKKVFKNLNKIKNTGLYFNDAYSPGKFTNDSVPAQMMGINILSEESKHRVKIFTDLDGKKIPFKFENTVFEDLHKKGLGVSLVSSVLEYCSSYLRSNKWLLCKDNISENKDIDIFNDGITYYFSLFFKVENYLNDLGFLKKEKYFETYEKNKMINFEDLDFNKLDNLKFDNSKFFADHQSLVSVENSVKILDKSNMLFLHFYVPHLHHRNQFLFDTLKLENNVNQKYLLRYLYVDFFTKELINEIRKKELNEVLLIISSDHWWRKKLENQNNQNYVGNSFFLVKNLNDEAGYSIDKKMSTLIIPNIIKKFFNKELNSNEDFFNYSKDLNVKVHIKGTRFNDK